MTWSHENWMIINKSDWGGEALRTHDRAACFFPRVVYTYHSRTVRAPRPLAPFPELNLRLRGVKRALIAGPFGRLEMRDVLEAGRQRNTYLGFPLPVLVLVPRRFLLHCYYISDLMCFHLICTVGLS
jgi:hypothetical protein